MTTGPRTVQRSSRLPSPTCTGPSSVVSSELAADVARDGAEHEPVGLEHVLELAGVLPPAGDHVRLDAQAAVDHVLDGVGDLELAAGAGRDGLDALEDGRREEVHAHQGEVAARLGRLLDEPRDAAVAVELGDAVALRVGDLLQEDERVRVVLLERPHERRDALLEQVVAEVHDERLVAEEGLADEHRVREAQRRLLRQVGDGEAERGCRRRPRPRSRRACRRRRCRPRRCRRPAWPRGRRRAPACWRPARAAWRRCG